MKTTLLAVLSVCVIAGFVIYFAKKRKMRIEKTEENTNDIGGRTIDDLFDDNEVFVETTDTEDKNPQPVVVKLKNYNWRCWPWFNISITLGIITVGICIVLLSSYGYGLWNVKEEMRQQSADSTQTSIKQHEEELRTSTYDIAIRLDSIDTHIKQIKPKHKIQEGEHK